MKTVTKKLFALLLVAVMMFSAVPFGAAASGMSDAPAAMIRSEHDLNWKIVNFSNDEVVDTGTDGVPAGHKVTLDWAKEQVEEGYRFLEAHVEFPALLSAKPVRLTEKRPYTVKSDVTVVIYVEPIEEEVPTEPVTEATEPETEAAEPETEAAEPETEAAEDSTPVIEAVPVSATTITAKVVEGKKTRTYGVAVKHGKMDILALLSENGYAVGEYTVVVDGKTYDLGALSAVPAPAGDTTTVELKAEDTAAPDEGIRHPVITFIANGGSWGRGKTELSVTVRHGHSLGNQMPDDPTMKNEKFAGWRIVDTDVYIDEDTKFYEDTNVEAVWVSRRDRFTITFDPNGGSLSRRDPKEIEVRYKEVLDDLPVPTHRHLEFQGWYDQTGKKWEDGDIFNITYDITLTAKWAKEAKVVLHIYMDGNTRKSVYDVTLDDYVVGDYITMRHVKREIWETGIEAKPGKQLEYDGLFDSETWERYVRHGRGGEDEIEIEDVRRNDIYVMVFNGQTHHRPWDPTNPKTGDQMMLEGAIAVMALAAVGVVTLATLRKKKVL